MAVVSYKGKGFMFFLGSGMYIKNTSAHCILKIGKIGIYRSKQRMLEYRLAESSYADNRRTSNKKIRARPPKIIRQSKAKGLSLART